MISETSIFYQLEPVPFLKAQELAHQYGFRIVKKSEDFYELMHGSECYGVFLGELGLAAICRWIKRARPD